MKKMAVLALWLLIFGGIVLGYEAVAHRDLLALLTDGNGQIANILKGAIGVSALIVLGGKISK
jgi:hypothetical protein